MGLRTGLIAFALLPPALPACAQDADPAIIVTAPGDDIDADDATRLGAGLLGATGTPGLLGAIARNVPGASLSDAAGNPFQPNLVFHGFSASALQGNAQGLAVYVDGVRFNQPFGDTANFDLLPDAAIESVTIKDVSPVYGLNALGGVFIIAAKTGKTAPGVTLSAAGGDHGRAEASVEAGWSDRQFSAYAALQARHDDGWRRYSPSSLLNAYADLGWDGADAGVHAKWLGASTDLTGNGAAPVELLAADYRAVFTHPDTTRNRYWRFSLHPWARIDAQLRIEASLYAQGLRQQTRNGDTADIAACSDDPARLCLDSAANEGETRLVDNAGDPVADTLGGSGYGLLNRSETHSTAQGLLVQLVDHRALLAGENELILGLSLDRATTAFAASSELGALTPARSVAGLGTIIAQPDGAIAPVSLAVRTRYTGLFAADRLPLAPRLTAEIGLRWNEARIALDDRLGTALNGRHRFRRLNPGIELDYDAPSGLSLRGGYAETNRAPTPAELSCADAAAPCSLTNFFVGDPPLRQVVARTFELGAAGEMRGTWTLRWQIAGYRTDNSDDIQFTAAQTRGRAYFRNVGGTRRTGLDVTASLNRGAWTLRAGYAFIDATFRSPFVLDSPDNPSADENGRIEVRPGARLPGIPRHRGTASIEYAGDRFTLGADMQAQSGQILFGDEAGNEAATDGFMVAGVHGSVRLAHRLTLFAEVANLFDARHATFGTFSQVSGIDLAEAPGAQNPRSLGPGAPRRWRVGVRSTF